MAIIGLGDAYKASEPIPYFLSSELSDTQREKLRRESFEWEKRKYCEACHIKREKEKMCACFYKDQNHKNIAKLLFSEEYDMYRDVK